jgi:hypothetical protein
MATTFNDLVERILDLPLDEKEEMKNIIDHSIIENRRDDIYKNYLRSKKEEKTKKLVFTKNISELKNSL